MIALPRYCSHIVDKMIKVLYMCTLDICTVCTYSMYIHFTLYTCMYRGLCTLSFVEYIYPLSVLSPFFPPITLFSPPPPSLSWQPLCAAYNELARTYTGRKVRPVHDLIVKYREVFQAVSSCVYTMYMYNVYTHKCVLQVY